MKLSLHSYLYVGTRDISLHVGIQRCSVFAFLIYGVAYVDVGKGMGRVLLLYESRFRAIELLVRTLRKGGEGYCLKVFCVRSFELRYRYGVYAKKSDCFGIWVYLIALLGFCVSNYAITDVA